MLIANETTAIDDHIESNPGDVLNAKSNISIVIPSFNSAGTIAKLMNSISESTQKPYEVIVVDDCSRDHSAGIVLEGFKWAKIITLNKNSGPSRARNIGAFIAKKDIILFLDADVVLTPGAIGAVEERHVNHPEIAGLQGRYHWEAANPGLFPSYKALINHYWFVHSRPDTGVDYLVTYACTIKRHVMLEAGGFSEAYKGADVEDYELGYRISKKHALLHEPQLEVHHHFPDFLRNSRNYYERGSKWFPLFMKRKRFDNSGGTTKREAVSRLLGGISFCSLFLPLIHHELYIVTLCTTFIYLFANLELFAFCFKRKGIKYLLLGMYFHYLSSIVICCTMVLSVFTYMINKDFNQ